MSGSRKNPFPGRRGVAHLLVKPAPKKEKKQLTPSQLQYKRINRAKKHVEKILAASSK